MNNLSSRYLCLSGDDGVEGGAATTTKGLTVAPSSEPAGSGCVHSPVTQRPVMLCGRRQGLHSVLRILASTDLVDVAAEGACWAPGEEVFHLEASEGSAETPEAEPWD